MGSPGDGELSSEGAPHRSTAVLVCAAVHMGSAKEYARAWLAQKGTRMSSLGPAGLYTASSGSDAGPHTGLLC